MTQHEIREYNKELVNGGCIISIINYVNKLNAKFYKIDISFLDDFVELINKDDCCISHELLQKHDIYKFTAGTSDIKKLIEQNKGVDGLDFLRINYECDDYAHKIKYFFHPTLFKKILMRNRNTDKYVNYYLLLEKCMYYYNEYEKLKLEQKIEQINEFKLLELEHCDTLDNFVIVKDDRKKIFKYGIIRGSTVNLKQTLHDLDLSESDIILRLFVPHALNFNKKIKEFLHDNYSRQKFFIFKDKEGKTICKYFQVEVNGEPPFAHEDDYLVTINRWFVIVGVTEHYFFKCIKDIHDSRFE